MPTVVFHLLVPIFLAAIFRDFLIKNKNKFPLHYVLIAGIGGVLPDIDVLVYIILGFFNYSFLDIHRTITHSIFMPLIFIILSAISVPLKNKTLGKHKLRLHWIFLALAFGIISHIALDYTIQGKINLFSPISNQQIGLNLINYLPLHIQGFAIPLLEGVLLLLYFIYLEWKHKISDFI